MKIDSRPALFVGEMSVLVTANNLPELWSKWPAVNGLTPKYREDKCITFQIHSPPK
jgi:hypothetical protein